MDAIFRKDQTLNFDSVENHFKKKSRLNTQTAILATILSLR